MWTTEQRARIKSDIDAKFNWDVALGVCDLLDVSGLDTIDAIKAKIHAFIDGWNPDQSKDSTAFIGGPFIAEYSPASSLVSIVNGETMNDKPDVRVHLLAVTAWVDG